MNPRRTFLAAFLAAATLTALIHGRSLTNDFVYDDLWTIVRNPGLKDPVPGHFFTDPSTAAAPETGMGLSIYRPLPTWTFALNLKAADLKTWAWRLPDLLLHALNGALIFLLLTGLLGLSAGAAALGAAVFLVHPVQVESALWITQRSNLLCAAGGLAALIFAGRGSLWSLAAYGIALFSKESAVTLLPFLVLAARSQDRRRWKSLAAAFVVSVIAYLTIRSAVVGSLAQRDWRGGFIDNLLVGQASWLEYVRLLLWPAHLSASHLQYVDNPWEHPAPWIGAALLVLWVCVAAVLWRRTSRRAALAMVWIPVTLSPHLGLLPLDTFVAERFLYLPMAGAAALAALAWEARKGRASRTSIAVLTIVLAVRAYQQGAAWRDELTLWLASARAEPHHSFIRLCLAEAYYARGRFPAAAQATREALTLNPPASLAFSGLNNLSDLALKEGRPGAALRFADRALQIEPGSPHARRNRERARLLLKKPRATPPE